MNAFLSVIQAILELKFKNRIILRFSLYLLNIFAYTSTLHSLSYLFFLSHL